jgi:hypothetical protein
MRPLSLKSGMRSKKKLFVEHNPVLFSSLYFNHNTNQDQI